MRQEAPWELARSGRLGRRAVRQVFMGLVLVVLVGLIGAYWYLTDSNRVRAMAESYLSGIVGAHVEVKDASLSIFEGLRLDDVSVRVDREELPDSELFAARSLLVRYSVNALLSGRIEASEIIAVEPRVRLCENLDLDRWNYHRLGISAPATTSRPSIQPGERTPIPQVLLRGGQIDYSRIVRGVYEPLGSIAVEGQFGPGAEPGQYRFAVESRGIVSGVGPAVRGTVNSRTRQVEAALTSLDFRGPIRSMLPSPVHDWMENHQATGVIDAPVFRYAPGPTGAQFRLEAQVNGIGLAIRPEEWLDPRESRRLEGARQACRGLAACGFNPAGAMTQLRERFQREPIRLVDVKGQFIFTQDGIEIRQVAGQIERNSFDISGRINGYNPTAAADLTFRASRIMIPEDPHYVAALPPEARDVYRLLRPGGLSRLDYARILRKDPDGPVAASGQLSILDGSFRYRMFPYPLHHVSGRVRFGVDPKTGFDRVDLEDVTGRGSDDGANAGASITVNGYISPLNDLNEVHLDIAGRTVVLDDELYAALPPGTAGAMRLFAPADGKYAQLRGGFDCRVRRPYGPVPDYRTNVDLFMDNARGAYEGFPYPLENLKGTLRISDDSVLVEDVSTQRNGATLAVEGRIDLLPGGKITPNLLITGRAVPIDANLLAALPPKEREAVSAVGLGGTLDIDGHIHKSAATAGKAQRPFDYDLRLKLRDGTVWPVNGKPALCDIAAGVALNGDGLIVERFEARRRKAPVTGSLRIDVSEQRPTVELLALVQDLAIDASLMEVLSADARSAVAQVRPEGSVDVEVRYHATPGPTTVPATTAPAAASTRPAESPLVLTIRPRQLAVSPLAFPYRVENLRGEVTVAGRSITLKDVAGKHGEGTVAVSGDATLAEGPAGTDVWNLKVSAAGLKADADLRRALPDVLGELFDSLKLEGTLSVEMPRFIYRASSEIAPSTRSAVTRPAPAGDVDFHAIVKVADGQLDAGVALSAVNGSLDIAGKIADGTLASASGKIDLASLQIAGRDAKNVRCELIKPAEQDVLKLADIQGQLAGGELAGHLTLGWSKQAPSGFELSLVLRNGDVRELARENEKGPQGRVSASLALEGAWSEPNRRRGRGDVQVSGKELYRIPLVLGLLEVTNLALPINSPFSEASTSYSLDGQRVTFEQIELRSGTMRMEGQGYMDFASKRVALTFTTENPNWPKLPLVSELIQGAREELLQIQVNGTIQEPHVSARSFHTFTTTVDEVLKGQTKPLPKKK